MQVVRRDQKFANRGYEQLTVSAVAAGFASVPDNYSDGVCGALIQCQDAQVRWRDDGTAPTASVGMVMNAGDTLIYDGDIKRFKAILTTAAVAKLNVSYYG